MAAPLRQDYFAEPHRYLDRNFRIAIRREIVAELLGPVRGKTILDLGCGNGAVSAPFAASNRLILVDRSERMIERARAVPGALAYVADAADVRETADIVMALGLLAHVDDWRGMLDAIAGRVRRNGKLVLQFSDADKAVNRLARELFHLKAQVFSCAEPAPMRGCDVIQACSDRGLTPEARRDHLVMLPAMHRLLGSALPAYDRLMRRTPFARFGLDTLMVFRA